MTEERSLIDGIEVLPQVRRKQKIAWWLMLVGVILGSILRVHFVEAVATLVTFLMLKSTASNGVVRLFCKRMIWVQAILAILLLAMSLMWVELGGDIIELDAVVILVWIASVWCYAGLAKSETLSPESLGWLNVIVTFVIVKALFVSLGDDDFMEAYSGLSVGWVFVAATAWRRLIQSEAFVGKDLVPTSVEPRKAFGLVNKYTILGIVPLVVVILWLFA